MATSNEFISDIIDESKDALLVEELHEVVDKEYRKSNIEPGKIGCTYGKSAFIIDGDGREIHRGEHPRYYEYLHAWYHI